MRINLSAINFDDRQTLILRGIDDTPIGVLEHAFDLNGTYAYNEISTITFSYPSQVNGVPTPYYDQICGTMNVELLGIGVFKLYNPKETNDGIKSILQCEARSLECELTHKTVILSEDTYCIYNPVAKENTICGMFIDDTGWSIGRVDSDLIGRYRTFEVNDNWYNFIKSTVQEKYGCIWEFDTSTRTVNLRSIEDKPAVKPVFISTSNLAKEIEIEEQTEDIRTVLDVNGADGVDIRAVSPTGGNKIYNLDYYIQRGLFPARLVDAWQDWKSAYQGYRVQYYNVTVQNIMNTQKLVTEQAALSDLEVQKKSLENILSLQISGDQDTTETKAQIKEKEAEISAKKEEIAAIEADGKEIMAELTSINEALAFEKFFPSPADLSLVKRFFIEDSLSEDSFVYVEVNTYTGEAINKSSTNVEVTLNQTFKEIKIDEIELDDGSLDLTNTKVTFREKTYYRGSGFSFTIHQTEGDEDRTITGEAVSICLEKDSSNKVVMSIYAKVQTEDEQTVHANITVVGVATGFTEGSSLTFSSSEASFYYTRNTSDYQRQAVEWDLYDYGLEALQRLAFPSYNFSVNSANFFSLEQFESFKREIQLGQKIFLEARDGQILNPILIGVEVSYNDPSSLTLSFSDSYNSSDSAFRLKDLLSDSISMGKTLNLGKFNYNSYINSGAQTNVGEFMSSALDVSLNNIKGASGQAMEWDQTGLRLRKEEGDSFSPEQIWMTNNTILFTDDAWESGKMAIGQITAPDGNGTLYGIVAQYLVGNILAGNALVIESEARAGENAVFRVDGEGASLHNAVFQLLKGSGGRISLDPSFGITAGNGSYFTYDDNGYISGIKLQDGSTVASLSEVNWQKQDGVWKNAPQPNFWVDMNGDAFFRGKVYATDGYFSGTVYATDGEFSGTIHATDGEFKGVVDASGFKINGVDALIGNKISSDFLELRGLAIPNASNPAFAIDSQGHVTINGGSISFGSLDSSAQDKINSAYDTANGAMDAINDLDIPTLPSYIKSTYIDSTSIQSPDITGGILRGAEVQIIAEQANLVFYDSGKTLRGAIYYDSNGSSSLGESSSRLFVNAINSALKLNATRDISIGNPSWGANGYRTYIYNPYLIGTITGSITATFG